MVTVPHLGSTTKKEPRRKELADMPRQRKQSGYIYQRAGWWILRYREDVYQSGQLVRKQLAKQLQAVAPEHHRLKRPPASVAKLAESFLAPLNNQSTPPIPPAAWQDLSMLSIFPTSKSTCGPVRTTVIAVSGYHLEPRCGQIRLRDSAHSMENNCCRPLPGRRS
jgi:hypothetical protein